MSITYSRGMSPPSSKHTEWQVLKTWHATSGRRGFALCGHDILPQEQRYAVPAGARLCAKCKRRMAEMQAREAKPAKKATS